MEKCVELFQVIKVAELLLWQNNLFFNNRVCVKRGI